MNGKEKEEKRLRFTFEDDVITLREVVSRNPFENGCAAWVEIQTALLQLTQKEFSVKTIRQHIQLLLEQWEKKEARTQKSSGIEEPYSERDSLLQELSDLVEGSRAQKKDKAMTAEKKKVETEMGKASRDFAAMKFLQEVNAEMNEESRLLETGPGSSDPDQEPNKILEPEETLPEETGELVTQNLSNSKNILGPIRKRSKKATYMRRSGLDFLRDKNDKERELEERKVAVAERNATLAEKRFSFETEQFRRIIDSQQAVIDKLLGALEKMTN